MDHQTSLTQYHEAFWGLEFTGTAGFDVLSRRNTDQKRFLKDFEEYLRNRSKLELEYSKGLSQLGKAMRERTAVGVMDNAWNFVVAEVDSSQQAHEAAHASLYQQADHVKRLCRELTARRDTIEDRVKQFHSQKISQYKTVQSLNKTYNHKCREHDQLADAFQVMDREVTRSVRDLEKAKSKMDKSEDDVNKADVAYRNGVHLLEERRRDWEREMEQACKEFQNRDEEQIQFMRVQMWSAMNALSTVALQVDEGCEHVREMLETCEIDDDIQRFIAANATGTCRPAAVPYLNYYDNNHPQPSGSFGGGGISNGPPRIARAPLLPLRRSSSSNSTTSLTPPTPRPTACCMSQSKGVEELDPTYSSADPIYSTADVL